jgi:hypothetical protein
LRLFLNLEFDFHEVEKCAQAPVALANSARVHRAVLEYVRAAAGRAPVSRLSLGAFTTSLI